MAQHLFSCFEEKGKTSPLPCSSSIVLVIFATVLTPFKAEYIMTFIMMLASMIIEWAGDEQHEVGNCGRGAQE